MYTIATTAPAPLSMTDALRAARPAVPRQAGAAAPPRGGFDAFYSAAFAPLVVQLTAYTGDRTEAQDVVQEAFVRAWPRWEKIAEYDDPTAWVRRVAWNLATSRWRRTRVALSAAVAHRVSHTPPAEPDRIDLERALATLPPNQRRAIVLHHIAGLPITEIAVDCGVAEGTVKSWLHRARAALARELTGKGYR